MRGLTVKAPWAWCIVCGGKHTENRTALWTYRGPLLIHSGAGWSERGADDRRVADAIAAHPERTWGTTSGGTPGLRSHILGVADLVDVHPDAECCRPWGESTYTEAGGRERRSVTHLVLEDVRPLPQPVPYRHGRLGLWTPPHDLVAEVTAALEAA